MTRAATIAGRLHGDYLQRERLDDFQALLRTALEHGYRTMPLSAFAALIAAGAPRADDRILLLRHDVDTDVRRARRMWEMEHRIGVVGTTSSVARRGTSRSWGSSRRPAATSAITTRSLRRWSRSVAASAAEARALIGAARDRLRTTVPELRARTGLALDVFAAHGDFANRAVGVSNVELLSDPALRAELGVRLEAYDIESHVSARSSDGIPPRGWQPEDPKHAIRRGEAVVAVLLHPRSWGGAPAVNARADLVRLREGCVYRLRRARRPR